MAEEQTTQHVISLFRFRTRNLTPAQGEECSNIAERLMRIASRMPGFVSHRQYKGDTDEVLRVVEFASAYELEAWHKHPEHQEAQQRGRDEFYAEYQIVNCVVMNKHEYKHP